MLDLELKSKYYREPLPVSPQKEPEEKLLQEAALKKEEYRSKLRHGIWLVEFTKVDGTPSAMQCTLDSRLIPPWDDVSAAAPTRQENPTVLRVYALDRQGWRSFKVLNVTKFYQQPELI